MRKGIAILFVSLLVACGGGTTVPSGSIPPRDIAVMSNKQITGMMTRIVVDENVLHLDDVGLYALFEDDVSKVKDISFGVGDYGKVEKIVLEDFELGNDVGVYDIEAVRKGEANTFLVVYNENSGGVRGEITYNSLGKELGLTYADFGTLDVYVERLSDGIEIRDKPFFAGGYKIKQISKEEINTQDRLVFSGKAIGRVTATSDVETNEVDVLELAGDAELTFYDGVEQIKANFDNWYDVDVECQGSNVQSVTLKNYSEDNPTGKDEMFGMEKPTVTDMKTNYYGDGVPTEAVGFIGLEDENVNAIINFGVKK